MGNVMSRRESINKSADNESSVAKTVKESMVHWSQVSEAACNDEGEASEIDNTEVFKHLQSHPRWGRFFKTFGYSLGIHGSVGSLEVGKKFAEGGQAELFHAHVKWNDPKGNEEDLRQGREWVLKVFKKGTLLRHLQSQWLIGYLESRAEDYECQNNGIPLKRLFCCHVHCGVLLENNRFAFLMIKEQKDLRSFINHKMLEKREHSMPFSRGLAETMMFRIAEGMDWFHRHNIVHRDLKAANVLYSNEKECWGCWVADYECSVGVVGTRFWRAPEILQALKDRNIKPEVFTKEVDVYSYGITCYEILTRKLPFEGHSGSEYDLILKTKQRLELPKCVEDWMQELLTRCWEEDPIARPSFQEIMDLLATYSFISRNNGFTCNLFSQRLENINLMYFYWRYNGGYNGRNYINKVNRISLVGECICDEMMI